MVNFLFFFLSLAILLWGANSLVTCSVKLAQKLRISPLIIGATAVAIGTSVPEMMVALNAAWVGKGGLVIGNIIGANAANAGLILGLSFLCGKIRVGTRKTQILSRLAVLTAVFFATLLLLFGGVSRFWATLLLAGALCIFAWEVYVGKKGGEEEDAALLGSQDLKIWPPLLLIFVMMVSLLAVCLSGQLFVLSALNLAEFLKIKTFVVGLTIVSLGTTLPEFSTSLVAVFKKEEKLILGNILGSIIYNFLLVGGLGGVISFLPNISLSPLVMMVFLVSLLAFLIYFYRGRTIPFYWGILPLLGYFLFLFTSV